MKGVQRTLSRRQAATSKKGPSTQLSKRQAGGGRPEEPQDFSLEHGRWIKRKYDATDIIGERRREKERDTVGNVRLLFSHADVFHRNVNIFVSNIRARFLRCSAQPRVYFHPLLPVECFQLARVSSFSMYSPSSRFLSRAISLSLLYTYTRTHTLRLFLTETHGNSGESFAQLNFTS